ncbi:tRNA-specific 2-thiouridylase MnmA [Pirellulimonas nuda]|uniref:tRNA-specific 2-thiouridylase MnmA n=2 Tax=Pirellulimonas nuda TaxID=2528009 RepID=A0A518DJQ5_9BACT|nr:tRNA-specific 2-thiouridylase MnmA [Pirellulimonas nuda]
MSGGVDSSVAAHLLLEQGHDVVGVFMRHGEKSPAACDLEPASAKTLLPIIGQGGAGRLDHKQGCCTASDAEDARRVADRLAIPFYAIDLQAEFGRIIDYFADEYARGRTPNPCVQCNNWIKFGKLFDYADAVGAQYVATGHYARLRAGEDGAELLRGVDAGKDQSYVLFGIDRGLLPRMLLPVGGFEKPAIRRMAAAVGLNVATKKDSQEICFVTSGRYDALVKHRRPEGAEAGELVSTSGEVLGRHAGVAGFTVGQRKGLGVALGERQFVVRIEPQSNRVVLGSRDELMRSELTAARCNWLVDTPIGEPLKGLAQIRYNAPPAGAVVTRLEGDRLQAVFDQPQFGVAPGQAVVCYGGDRVLGGGWIE